LESQLI